MRKETHEKTTEKRGVRKPIQNERKMGRKETDEKRTKKRGVRKPAKTKKTRSKETHEKQKNGQ